MKEIQKSEDVGKKWRLSISPGGSRRAMVLGFYMKRFHCTEQEAEVKLDGVIEKMKEKEKQPRDDSWFFNRAK